MKIENEIISSVIAAVKELYGQDVPEKMVALQKTKSNFEGNLTLVVFPFLKMSKKKPEDTAQEIGEYLKKNCANVIADFNVVKGFLNLSIAPAAWVGLLNTINADPKFGEKPVTENSPLVMIEYSSPNTNKPLHLGHVRNNLLGWSLAQIMEANGNKVIKTNIVNDRGIHICKSMLCDFLTIVLVEGYIVVADEVVALLAGSLRSFAIAPLEPGEHRLTDVDTTVVNDVCLDYLVAVSLHNLSQ